MKLDRRSPTLEVCLKSRKGCKAFSLLDSDGFFSFRTVAPSGETRRVWAWLSSQRSAAPFSAPNRIREVDSASGEGGSLVFLRLWQNLEHQAVDGIIALLVEDI